MKAKVLKRFRDKHTHAIYEPGQVIEATEERAEEITAALGDSYIEEVKEPKKDKDSKGKEKPVEEQPEPEKSEKKQPEPEPEKPKRK